jgi:hypothetical protein
LTSFPGQRAALLLHKKGSSCRLHAVALDRNGKRSLDQLDGNNEALLAFHRNENTFDTIETSTSNANPLSDFQALQRVERDLSFDDTSHGSDFRVGNTSAEATAAHKSSHAARSQHGHSGARTGRNLHENVAREKGQVDELPTVSPLALFREQRKERFDALKS